MHLILIVIDCLRQDSLMRLYEEGKLQSGLKFLLDNGTVCTNAYAAGCPTQFSFPSIFTSTLPLDYGGYDRGILDRPLTLAEALSSYGYYCFGTAVGTGASEFYGYARGFDKYIHTYDIDELINPIINEIYKRYYHHIAGTNQLTKSEAAASFKSYMLLCIPFIKKYIVSWKKKNGNDFFYPKKASQERLSNYYDELIEFEKRLKSASFNPIEAVFPPLHRKRETHSLFDRICMTLANKFFPNILIPQYYFFPTLYSEKIFDLSIGYFKKYPEKKQFHFLHILDVHERRFTSNQYQINFIPILNTGSTLDKEMYFYEKAICYVDLQVGNYLEKVYKIKDKSDVAIALIGDHGHQYGYPNRVKLNQLESPLCDIYHESLDCSMVFFDPRKKSRVIKDHCSLLDLSPSILDLLDLSKERNFKGQSVFSPRTNKIVISESCGGGPCHFPTKPIYLSVKKPPYKMIYREFFHPNEAIRKKTELYHLDDRYEQNDISRDPRYKKVLKEMEQIARERIKKIRSFPGAARHYI